MNASSSEHFEFSCPSCLRPIKAGQKAAGKTLPCPGCGKTITVPTREDAMWDAIHEPPSVDEYGLAAPVERTKYTPVIASTLGEQIYDTDLDDDYTPVSRASYQPGSDSAAKKFDPDKLKITERPKLPPHPMTTGIFSMFADPSAITWFISLTFGFAVVIGILTVPIVVLTGSSTAGGAISQVGAAVGCGSGAVLGLGVFFFAANCLLCILQDSASGNRIIESWPDKAGGAFSTAGILFILSALCYSAVIGLLIALPLGIPWFPVVAGVCFLTFPFFLISALEVGSPITPISGNIVRSIFARFTTWLTFYIEQVIILAISLGALILIFKLAGQFLSFSLYLVYALVMGAFFTFLLFIYFRLLGRLVWVCDEWFRSLEPKKEDGDSDEADEEEWEEIPIR